MLNQVKRSRQLPLHFRSHGGRRPGAGRKRRSDDSVPHAPRPAFDGARQPLHVTLRMARGVFNLRSQRGYRVIERTLADERRLADGAPTARRAQRRARTDAAEAPPLRVVHYSVQGNHVHLVLEAADRAALSARMRSFSIRLARRLNAMMGRRRGRVIAERYHLHVLRTTREVRNAIRYVVLNHVRHAAQAGRVGITVDPFSSGPSFAHWSGPVRALDWSPGTGPPPVAAPCTWSLRVGWLRHGAIDAR
ncbi:MAG: hypothetical protein HYV09_29975 [Deltaproteobacteria bacterium]|nr:hypothetical protein [Deltaproteobacteria bacterium]